MSHPTHALLQADLHIAEGTIAGAEITRRCVLLETAAWSILARQAPVASDLRAAVSTLKDAADLQCMGALATHLARTGTGPPR